VTDVEVLGVDERDSSWEKPDPRFRVYLHGSGASATPGWTATYDITGADVIQVIDWAQRQAGDVLTYAVALVCDDTSREPREPGRARGLVWLLGADGNDSAELRRTAEAQQRMVGRRGAPLGIPEQDRMPDGAPSVGAELIRRLNKAQPPS
jgi:hypothetical protein